MTLLRIIPLSLALVFTSATIADNQPNYQQIEWPELMAAEDLAAIEAMPAIDHSGGESEPSADWDKSDWDNADFDTINSDSWQSDDWASAEQAPSEPNSSKQQDSNQNRDDSNGLSAEELSAEPDEQEMNSIVASAIQQAVTIRDQPEIAKAYEAALVSTKVREEFNNAKIRLAGFVVPLEFDDSQRISEFFLVPYFGACIHMPPPPPNQIIHVVINTDDMKDGFTLQNLYDPVWVSGLLKTELIENSVATSAYSMSASDITPYSDD